MSDIDPTYLLFAACILFTGSIVMVAFAWAAARMFERQIDRIIDELREEKAGE